MHRHSAVEPKQERYRFFIVGLLAGVVVTLAIGLCVLLMRSPANDGVALNTESQNTAQTVSAVASGPHSSASQWTSHPGKDPKPQDPGADHVAQDKALPDDLARNNSDGTGDLNGQLQEIIVEVENTYGGSVGISIATPGAAPSIRSAGSLESDVAWSTSKVPVAMAVVQRSGITSSVTAAITVSDNAAAEAMWASLGDPGTAAQAATQVLRQGGDAQTQINAERTRTGFTAFGQTQWALSNQAVFGANMLCVPGGAEVADLMGHISADQSYGLGTIPGAAFKGGWGPDTAGAYLVRQFGLVPGNHPGQYVGVAIAAKPADGAYATGQAMLNDIAGGLAALQLPAGHCG